MWQHVLILVSLCSCCLAGPLHGVKRNAPIAKREQQQPQQDAGTAIAENRLPLPEPLAPEYADVPTRLTLPSNATSIRSDITDNFSCEDKVYGYYADVENDCQIFHVCLPVTYADGKENTFRWSFICPEETVFSQDSFTCMRREDMSIACAESVKYYELNRNFGMAEEKNVEQHINSEQSIVEETAPEVVEPDVRQQQATITELQTESTEAAAAIPALLPIPSAPVKEKESPVRLPRPKPYRRKPQPKPQKEQGTSPAANKKSAVSPANKQPAVVPMRKVPTIAGLKVPITKPIEGVIMPLAEAERKPLVPTRYKKRPPVTFNSEKEVLQSPPPPFRIEMVSTASNPDSYKRKRPAITAVDKVPEKAPAEELAPEPVAAIEPIGTVNKFDSKLYSALPAKEETQTISEPIAVQAAEEPITSDATQTVSDSESEASETSQTIVAPESSVKTTEVKDAETTEAVNENGETLVAEESMKEDETLVQEATNSEKTVAAENVSFEEPKNPELPNAPIEAIEEIPAVISETIVGEPEAEKLDEATKNQQSETAPAGAISPQVVAPIEYSGETLPALPTFEELEEQKPADAVEVLPATAELEQQAPIVEQAFAEKGSNLQSVGGFKPVDPAIAAEAETLLSDFINALKGDNPNLKPMSAVPLVDEEEETVASVESEGTKADIGVPQQASEDKNLGEVGKGEATIEAEKESSKPVVVDEPIPVEEEKDNKGIESSAVDQAEDNPLQVKFPMSNSFPANIYQIPVTVIHTPFEELENKPEAEIQEDQKSEKEQADITQSEPQVETEKEKDEEVKTVEADSNANKEQAIKEVAVQDDTPAETQPEVTEIENTDNAELQSLAPSADENQFAADQSAAPAAHIPFRPISIDDIVELVKERLDQTPAAEKGTPMELIMEPNNAEKPIELKFAAQQKGSAATEESSSAAVAEKTPAEDIIFPIYHRLPVGAGVINSEIKAQESVAVEEPSALVKEIEKTQAVAQDLDVKFEEQKAIEKNTKTETVDEASATAQTAAEVPAETAAVVAGDIVKAKRALSSRSLARAKVDPRKRRFLFKADANSRS